MRLIVTGHREHKLIENNYDLDWIKDSIEQILIDLIEYKPLCYSGMASGVDLYFCSFCKDLDIPYIACIPFEEQADSMSGLLRCVREELISGAKEIKYVKNSWMVGNCDTAIVVFDGNKGGTANVFQQLIEKKINFYWINPVAKVVWKCFI